MKRAAVRNSEPAWLIDRLREECASIEVSLGGRRLARAPLALCAENSILAENALWY
jgi:hypothetical protein